MPANPFRCRLVFVALLAPALPLLVACSRPSAQRLNDSGNHAYARAEYPVALDDYRKAQVERPDLASLNYNAGNVLHQQGDYQRAIAESLRATRGTDADARIRAFYSVGSDYYREGKLKEALDAFKSALRLDPNDIDTKYNVEVIQQKLDAEAAQRQQQQPQDQQNGNQSPPPQGRNRGTPTPQAGDNQQQGSPTPQQGQQQAQQQGSPSQQPGNQAQQQGNASPQPGQQQGQQQGGQPGQQAGQPGQNGQPSQPTQGAGNQQPGGQPPASAGQGTGGTPLSPIDAQQQQQQLTQDLRNAIDAYQKAPSIEGELRILDILAEQERIAQAEQGIRSDPRSSDK
jgi:Ca-activated chloride channel family protein